MNLTFFILTILLMVANLCWIIFFTPMVPDQEWAQKIFYLHVPIAWSGFLAYFIVMINGFLYLFSKDLKYDRIGHASAEIGTIFTSLVLITGPIWATPIWGIRDKSRRLWAPSRRPVLLIPTLAYRPKIRSCRCLGGRQYLSVRLEPTLR